MFLQLGKQQSVATATDLFEWLNKLEMWAPIQRSGTRLCHGCVSFNFSKHLRQLNLWVLLPDNCIVVLKIQLFPSLFLVSSSLRKICSPMSQQLPHSSKQNPLPECRRPCSWSKCCQWGNLIWRIVMCLKLFILAAWKKTMMELCLCVHKL